MWCDVVMLCDVVMILYDYLYLYRVDRTFPSFLTVSTNFIIQVLVHNNSFSLTIAVLWFDRSIDWLIDSFNHLLLFSAVFPKPLQYKKASQAWQGPHSLFCHALCVSVMFQEDQNQNYFERLKKRNFFFCRFSIFGRDLLLWGLEKGALIIFQYTVSVQYSIKLVQVRLVLL